MLYQYPANAELIKVLEKMLFELWPKEPKDPKNPKSESKRAIPPLALDGDSLIRFQDGVERIKIAIPPDYNELSLLLSDLESEWLSWADEVPRIPNSDSFADIVARVSTTLGTSKDLALLASLKQLFPQLEKSLT